MRNLRKYLAVFFILFSVHAFSLLAAGKNYVEGEVLVRFRDDAVKVEERQAVRSHKLSVLTEFRAVKNLCHMQTPPGADMQKIIRELSADPDVLYAEPNYIYKALVIPDDPGYASQWGLPRINMPDAWDKTTGSSDVIVAVIDTGIDYTHPDLSDSVWKDSQNNPGYNAIDNTSDPMDNNGHGTHCCGILGAIGYNATGVCGVNWHVSIMALKFLDSSGNGTLANAIKCIEYAIRRYDEGENVVATNNSWGGGTYSTSLYNAIAELSSRGILFVAAAGNNNRDNDVTPMYPASYNLPDIISVASSDQNDYRSTFSSYGRTSVDVAAPGEFIYSTVFDKIHPDKKYDYLSGTSMATPFVAGLAGLLSAYTGETDSDKLKGWILQGVTRLPQWTNITTTGGRLNAYEALRISALAEDILPVTNFTASRNAGTGFVDLSWTLPSGVQSVIIRRRTDTFPARWDDGAEIYTGAGTSFVDEDVLQGTPYYYGCWAYYGSGLDSQQVGEDEISFASYAYINSPPYKPECISPQNGDGDVGRTPLLKATAFVDRDNDTQQASRWQISTGSGFTVLRWDKTAGAVSQVTVDSGTLSYSTVYYWRVCYQDSENNWSEWSNACMFTTEDTPSGGGGGGGGCFIATAAFGSPLERHVRVFRDFRDKRLLTNGPGRAFVRWYYRHSPGYAAFISRHRFLKGLTKIALLPMYAVARLLPGI